MEKMIIEIMNQFGYIGVCFLIALENIFPPIPSEIILSFGGFMTTYSQMNILGVIIAATLGSMLGAIALYGLGNILTPIRLEQLLQKKLFRVLGFKKGDITKTIQWFDKYGKPAIFFGRCIPIIRSLISIPAGMAKINFTLFLFYTLLGSIVWNTVLVLLGSFLGNSWDEVIIYFDTYSHLTLLILVASCLIISILFIYNRMIKGKGKSYKN